jgi:micrococcal nuclease
MKTTLYQYALKDISVVDGDTLKAGIDLGFNVLLTTKIRIEGINCPEKNTPEGVAAKNFTIEWMMHKKEPVVLCVKNHKEDKYGRILGSVISEGQSLTDAIKIAGHGVDYDGGKR